MIQMTFCIKIISSNQNRHNANFSKIGKMIDFESRTLKNGQNSSINTLMVANDHNKGGWTDFG